MGHYRLMALILGLALGISMLAPSSLAWKNGSYTDVITEPGMGTHDWLAQKALAFVTANMTQYLFNNDDYYYYGTELPDNPDPILDDGYGDTTKHHVYIDANGECTDDVGAQRAQNMYDLALSELRAGNNQSAAKYAGAMVHYIADQAVFGHTMSATKTPWGAETHHDDYESYVQNHHDDFQLYLSFDGALTKLNITTATINLAKDTTLDTFGNGRTCVWMDTNYDWTDSAFKDRAGQSINLAVNLIADALYSLALDAQYTYDPNDDVPQDTTPQIDDTGDDPNIIEDLQTHKFLGIPLLYWLALIVLIVIVAIAYKIRN